MGRGNGPRAPLMRVPYYHNGYLYEILGNYGPVERKKVTNPAEFAEFEPIYRAWLDSGHLHQPSDENFRRLMAYSCLQTSLDRESRKSYDFEPERRRLSASPSPPPACYTPPYLALVYVEGDNLVGMYESGLCIRLPL